jgi:hypothetical protein
MPNHLLLPLTAAVALIEPLSASSLHENVGPAEDNQTFETKAPSGHYEIIQASAKRKLKTCEDGPCYQTTVHFEGGKKHDQVLPEIGASKGVSYQTAADYTISPDERWFVRDQHIFAGWNMLVLYKVEPNGAVHQVADNLVELGLKAVVADIARQDKAWANVSVHDFMHLSGENVVWKNGPVLHFEVYGRPEPDSPKFKMLRYIEYWGVDYNVRTLKMTVTSPKPLRSNSLGNRSSQTAGRSKV